MVERGPGDISSTAHPSMAGKSDCRCRVDDPPYGRPGRKRALFELQAREALVQGSEFPRGCASSCLALLVENLPALWSRQEIARQRNPPDYRRVVEKKKSSFHGCHVLRHSSSAGRQILRGSWILFGHGFFLLGASANVARPPSQGPNTFIHGGRFPTPDGLFARVLTGETA